MTPTSPAPAAPDRAAAERDAGLVALYLHWPFSRAVPPYCDFHHVVRPTIDEARWRRALCLALERAAERLAGRRLVSVFVGGGTPSLMAPATLEALLAVVERSFGADPGREVTFEADPEPDQLARLPDYRAAGVDRLSLRVRSLRDAGLAFMKHPWSADEARRGAEAALRLFPRATLDLFYGWPGQSADDWLRELREAAALGFRHLSIYELAPLPGTAFEALAAAGRLDLAPEEAREAMYLDGAATLEGLGLPAYEIANFAAPGEEARHNDHVWRGGPYVGVGPGAVGRLGLAADRRAVERLRDPESWLASVEAGGEGTAADEPLPFPPRLEERLQAALRRRDGLTRADARRAFGVEIEGLPPSGRLRELVADGFLVLDGRGLRATAAGWPVLDAVLARLLDGAPG